MTGSHVLEFCAYGEPIPQGSKSILPAGSKRGGRPILVEGSNRRTKTKPANRLRDWRSVVGISAKVARVNAGLEVLDEALLLGCMFVMPRPKSHRTPTGKLKKGAPLFPTAKPDLSKLIRAVEDAMQGVIYRDDSLIVGYVAPCKIFDDEHPAGVSIEVFRV